VSRLVTPASLSYEKQNQRTHLPLSFFSFFTAKKQKKYKPKFQTHFSIFILSSSLKTVSSHEFSSLTLTENRFSSPKENFPVRKSIAKPVGLFW
jgi:hypothetical protein